MKEHISRVVSSCCFQLRRLLQIRRCAGEEVIKRLVTGLTALVLSRLDYCNAVLAGLPESTIRPLQRVQNAAACLITTDTKPISDHNHHITPVLMHLHWLPIKLRILYKLCLLMHLIHIHTNQRPDYMAEMVELSATSSSRSGLRSASASSTGRQRWKPSSVSHVLLPGTVSQTTFSLSQTPNFSRNLSKLTCLQCHFNSLIYFIVCRNMKCPPTYFVGGQ